MRLPPIGSRQMTVSFTVQRVESGSCGNVRQEHLVLAETYKSYTRSFARHVVELSYIGTVKDVERHLGVGWDLVRETQQKDLEWRRDWIDLKSVRQVGIDELAVGKGQRCVSVFLDMDSRGVIRVADGRGADAVKPFLRRLKRCGTSIEAFVAHMGPAFAAAGAEVFPGVDLAYDRFHVVKLMNQKLSDPRRDMQREAADILHKDVLKGTRRLLLKNPENLATDKGEWDRLQEALAFNHPPATAYCMKGRPQALPGLR